MRWAALLLLSACACEGHPTHCFFQYTGFGACGAGYTEMWLGRSMWECCPERDAWALDPAPSSGAGEAPDLETEPSTDPDADWLPPP